MKRMVWLFAALMLATMTNAQENGRMPVKIADTGDQTQDFFDNAPAYALKMEALQLEGEIENPGTVDFSKLTKRTVIVKEALLQTDGSNRFVGAYRYDGYSLYDILNTVKLKKKNAREFPPIIDLYLEIEMKSGEKVVVSWGELYYPNSAHRILIASDVARIVPSKTKELWPLPTLSKLVFANDLVTERNLDLPVKIIVKSYSRKFAVDEKHEKMFSLGIDVYVNEKNVLHVRESGSKFTSYLYHSIFYGRGRGIHSTTPFKGIQLKDALSGLVTINSGQLKNGFIAVAAEDGYRVVYTVSEVFNRNDQQEILLIENPEEKDGGVFKLFPACDFFSDRAVKAVKSIYFEQVN